MSAGVMDRRLIRTKRVAEHPQNDIRFDLPSGEDGFERT